MSPSETAAGTERPALDLTLYLVTDTARCGERGVPAVVREAVAGGVTCVQLRDKELDDEAFVHLGLEVREALAGTGVPLLLDDRVHLVHRVGADGVHIGQEDMPPVMARRELGPNALIGLSTHSVEEVRAANELPEGTLDYIGIGPVWPTPTKAAHAPAIGPEGARAMRAASRHPGVAIGGISLDSLAELRDTGAEGIAVVRALCTAPDVRVATSAFREAWR
ncbi:thiamine phosphate synthase [Kytococcus sp. Marseille-QA3725]